MLLTKLATITTTTKQNNTELYNFSFEYQWCCGFRWWTTRSRLGIQGINCLFGSHEKFNSRFCPDESCWYHTKNHNSSWVITTVEIVFLLRTQEFEKFETVWSDCTSGWNQERMKSIIDQTIRVTDLREKCANTWPRNPEVSNKKFAWQQQTFFKHGRNCDGLSG
jgi:hypothetical protein